MEVRWKDALWKAANEIMIKGGELHFKVIKRERERIAEVYIYPENRVRCRKETIID